MNDKYNYYDSPDNHPVVKKYRSWEAIILIFGIGVVTSLLALFFMFGKSPQKQLEEKSGNIIQASVTTMTPAIVIVTPVIEATIVEVDRCEMMYGARINRPADTERLSQLLIFAEYQIMEAYVTAFANICVLDIEKEIQEIESAKSDITVVIGETDAAYMSDFEAMGDIIADILPAILKTEPEDPQTITIRFLARNGFHEWRGDYMALTRQFTVDMRGLELWELKTLSDEN